MTSFVTEFLMTVAAATLGRQLEDYFAKAFGEKSTRSRHFVVVFVDDGAGVVTIASDITDPARVAFVLGKAVHGLDAGEKKGPVN